MSSFTVHTHPCGEYIRPLVAYQAAYAFLESHSVKRTVGGLIYFRRSLCNCVWMNESFEWATALNPSAGILNLALVLASKEHKAMAMVLNIEDIQNSF